MALSREPRLPDPRVGTLLHWALRLTARINEMWRELWSQLNPWIGPSWEDLRFPVQGVNPAGAAAPPSVDNTTYPGTLLFSGSASNDIGGVAQLPHGWYEGSGVRPHIHWTKTAADVAGQGVTWEFRYAVGRISETVAAYSSWGVGTLVAGDLTTAERHNLTAFSEIDMTGGQGSDMIIWGVRRRGDTDSYTAVCRLLEFDFHYQLGQLGSSNKQEYPV